MIAIVDYGMGNLRSVRKAFEHLGFKCEVTQDADVIRGADKVVMPGVGAFADCMRNLAAYGLIESLRDACASRRPFLGICLGLQALFDHSEEGGAHQGLGVIPGKVVRFDVSLKTPHMGWNRIKFKNAAAPCAILDGVEEGSYVYFVHSYFAVPRDQHVVAAETDYGGPFAAAVCSDKVFAVQFHPEKSQETGLKILRNFAEL